MPSILFVCMGNICRSPTAHGVMLHKIQRAGLSGKIQVDSAGTHDYHASAPPDERAQSHAASRGYDIAGLRARQIVTSDFANFDLLLAMDRANLAHLQAHCPAKHQHKLQLLTDFCTQLHATEVPDPYYGNNDGFERVLDLVEDACDGLLHRFR